MALYRNRLSSDPEAIFESFECFILNEDDELNNKIKESEDKLDERLKKLEDKESELKKVINNKPRSWLERKLLSFKVALRKFEIKYKLTKSGRAKSIIRKILSILVRVIKWINDQLIKITRWVYNVPLGNGYKLEHRRSEMRNIKNDIKLIKRHSDLDKRFIDKYKNELK